MTAIQQVAQPLQASLVKMEDRKRPPSYENVESGPPAKKLATSSNGAGKAHPDADMPWRDDLEVSTLPRSLGMPLSNAPLELSTDCVTDSASKKMLSTGKCKSISVRRMC